MSTGRRKPSPISATAAGCWPIIIAAGYISFASRRRGFPVVKADPRPLALEALCRAVADPRPRVLYGTAKAPGIFIGTGQAVKNAANLCLDQHCLEPTREMLPQP